MFLFCALLLSPWGSIYGVVIVTMKYCGTIVMDYYHVFIFCSSDRWITIYLSNGMVVTTRCCFEEIRYPCPIFRYLDVNVSSIFLKHGRGRAFLFRWLAGALVGIIWMERFYSSRVHFLSPYAVQFGFTAKWYLLYSTPLIVWSQTRYSTLEVTYWLPFKCCPCCLSVAVEPLRCFWAIRGVWRARVELFIFVEQTCSSGTGCQIAFEGMQGIFIYGEEALRPSEKHSTGLIEWLLFETKHGF